MYASVLRPRYPLHRALGAFKRYIATPQLASSHPVCEKRVLGVVAHIDAGKTTTSERMLYFAGSLGRVGNVDDGDTALDFLPAERERGITVNSASVCFHWRGHQLFLVDSPGHLDFTYEVQRALRVMDGVVVVLDAVAGVQPQTETVWRQAQEYSLPAVVFVNKMDRRGADFGKAVKSLKDRLQIRPAVLHMPLVNPKSGNWTGFVDLVSMEVVTRPTKEEQAQSAPEREERRQALHTAMLDPVILNEVDLCRERLVEMLADVDDEVMALWISGDVIAGHVLSAAVRRSCMAQTVVPVLCGSALKNFGIQTLLDSVVDFLPSPLERPDVEGVIKSDQSNITMRREERGGFLALAFKVVHDTHRGKMVFSRVYRGSLNSTERASISNVNAGKKELPSKLLRIMADDVVPVENVRAGDIFAAMGMKHTRTGDTLVARSPLDDNDQPNNNVLSHVLLDGVPPPPAVFSVALETESISQQQALDIALEKLLVEDPSLNVSTDPRSGETLLSGMGQLHLDIVLDRLRKSLGNPIHVSEPRVAYQETITSSVIHTEDYNQLIGSTPLRASLTIQMEPLTRSLAVKKVDATSPPRISRHANSSITQPRNEIVFSPELSSSMAVTDILKEAVTSSLSRGPLMCSPTCGIRVVLRSKQQAKFASSDAAASACASKAVAEALKKAQAVLLEPVMAVSCLVPDSCAGGVIGELTHPTERRGIVNGVEKASDRGDVGHFAESMIRIDATVPLKGVLDWSTRLRSLTKGRGDFSTTFQSYEPVPDNIQRVVVKAATELVFGRD